LEYEKKREMSETIEITLSNIKDFLLSKGGKVKYSELFDHFRNSIVDSSSGWRLLFYLHLI
jgi:hypothetical protein